MLMLTWHGTILRIERESGRLNHAPLVPDRDIATDFVIQLPPAGLLAPLAGPNDTVMMPGPTPGTAHLMRGDTYLSAPQGSYPGFTSKTAGPPETLLLLTDTAVAALRDLLSHAWHREDTGEMLQAADIALSVGPALRIAGISVVLGAHVPSAVAEDIMTIPHAHGELSLRRVSASRVLPREVAIQSQPPGLVPDVADAAAFRTQSPARLTLPAAAEIGLPPILVRAADRDFLYRRSWRGLPPVSGLHHLHSEVVRDRNKFVLLDRGVEGMILDETGVSNDITCIGNLGGAEPPHFAREGERYFLDRKMLDAAPFLAGAHAVFYCGGHRNYYHWLIDAMVSLSMIAPFLPPEATLLLPGNLAQLRADPNGKLDYIALLEAFGFGDMPRVEVPGQICRVEEVYWPGRCTISEVPAGALLAARDRVLKRLGPATGAKHRIYVKRAGTRSVINDAVVESVLTKNGFVPVLMEDLTVSAQIDLFRDAEMVVAAHGAAMANLIFCPPDTKVLELSPDCEYRPFFNEISTKLGLVHAVLPCETSDGTFDGGLVVPGMRLGLMLLMLMCRQAA
jgi:hypothetical protein